MPKTLISSTWTSGNLIFSDAGGNSLISLQDSDHLLLSSPVDCPTKTVRINSQTYTSAASIIGLQTKPRASVNMTNDIIGIESMPGMTGSAYTNSAGIVCFKAEPYIGSSVGTITGDVRSYESSLGNPSGQTVSGTMSSLKCINNAAGTVTGGVYPIYVITSGDATPWAGFAKLPDDSGVIADLASNASTINAVVKVKVGSTTTYLVGYTTYTA